MNSQFSLNLFFYIIQQTPLHYQLKPNNHKQIFAISHLDNKMVKHLYFNPRNFNELILSGVLIQIFRNDVEVHSHDEGETLRFVQGENVVENHIEGILRFANAISKEKIYGSNWQQQATINMINGVCKDIEQKLQNAENSSELLGKIEQLNGFWSNKANSWLRKKFFCCHMNILTLSFKIQERFPEILSRYGVFVELRKLFIEERLMSKESLIAMFAHSENQYQQFDLFPEMEAQAPLVQQAAVEHQVMVKLQDSTQQQNLTEQTHENADKQKTLLIEDSIQVVNSHTKEEQYHLVQTVSEHVHEKQTHHHENQAVESSHHQEKHHVQGHTQQNTENHIHPQNVVIPSFNHQQSIVAIDLPQQLMQTLEPTVVTQEFQDKNQSQNAENNKKIEERKQSFKQQSSGHVTKKHEEYTSRSFAEEQKARNSHQGQTIPDAIQQELKSNEHETKKIQQHHHIKQETAVAQPKHEPLIVEVESKQQSSKLQQKVEQQSKQEKQHQPKESASAQQNHPVLQEQKPQNNPPQSQSQASWQKGPTSNMNKTKIQPKQQSVVVHKQTCKCQIF